MLSNTCKYALRAVIYLAVNAGEKKIGIKKISEDLDIPFPFLGKILQILAKNKILTSTKGPHGGFGINKDQEKLSLMDVIQVIDGKDAFNMCVIGLKACKDQVKPCALHDKYARLREEMKFSFENQTIKELVKDINEGKQELLL